MFLFFLKFLLGQISVYPVLSLRFFVSTDGDLRVSAPVYINICALGHSLKVAFTSIRRIALLH